MIEINENIEDELDVQFPEGHKERGKALALFAIAQMELEKQARKIFDEIEKLIEKTKSKIPVSIQDSKFIEELKKLKMKYD